MADEKNEVIEEFKKAKEEGRQPRCIYCGEPLVVIESQYLDLQWNWDEKRKCYVKSETAEGSEKPQCKSCQAKDWDFTNNEYVEY